MTSAPVLQEGKTNETDMRNVAQEGIGIGRGVLWIVGAAAAWNVLLVLFHNLMARLLS